MVSHVNEDARAAGVVPGMTALAAADLLAATAMRTAARPPAVPEQPKATVVVPGCPPVAAVDSNADADWSAVSAILVTGSHGGVVGARAVTRPVAAAFFNDAGVGKEQAGIGRLPMLDASGIPGGTVSHDSARIGEGFDTFASGVISFLNETAAGAGLIVGTTLRDAVALRSTAIGRRIRTSSPWRKFPAASAPGHRRGEKPARQRWIGRCWHWSPVQVRRAGPTRWRRRTRRSAWR